jgi:hypothetical protein
VVAGWFWTLFDGAQLFALPEDVWIATWRLLHHDEASGYGFNWPQKRGTTYWPFEVRFAPGLDRSTRWLAVAIAAWEVYNDLTKD